MTAEPDLLPLPWIERYAVVGDIAYPVSSDPDGDYVAHDDHTAAMQAYARANVANATAAKDAEVEALRRDRDDCLAAREHYASLYGEQHGRAEQLQAELDNRWATGVHSCNNKCQRVACVLRRDNKRLAEALRELRNHTSVNSYQIALIDAALEQENDDA